MVEHDYGKTSGDKVTSVSTNVNYAGQSANLTIYTTNNKNNEEVHYASVGEAYLN